VDVAIIIDIIEATCNMSTMLMMKTIRCS